MVQVAVSIGSNLNREPNVKEALAALGRIFGELSHSPVYESAAYGLDGPPFYNLVVVFKTSFDVHAVRAKIQEIETARARNGKEPQRVEKSGP